MTPNPAPSRRGAQPRGAPASPAVLVRDQGRRLSPVSKLPRRRFAALTPSPVSKMDFTCSERVADAHREIRYIVDMTATRHVLEVRVRASE